MLEVLLTSDSSQMPWWRPSWKLLEKADSLCWWGEVEQVGEGWGQGDQPWTVQGATHSDGELLYAQSIQAFPYQHLGVQTAL